MTGSSVEIRISKYQSNGVQYWIIDGSYWAVPQRAVRAFLNTCETCMWVRPCQTDIISPSRKGIDYGWGFTSHHLWLQWWDSLMATQEDTRFHLRSSRCPLRKPCKWCSSKNRCIVIKDGRGGTPKIWWIDCIVGPQSGYVQSEPYHAIDKMDMSNGKCSNKTAFAK